jgi:alpha-glucosidase
MKKITFILTCCAFFMSLSASVEREKDTENTSVMAGNCSSFTVMGNKAVFSCENNVKVLIEQLGSGMLKIWVDQENFLNEKDSYAVLKHETTDEVMNLAEMDGSYEIYTGKLIVRVNKEPFQIRIFDKYQRLLMEDFGGKGYVADQEGMTSYKTLKPGERIYGLGEKNGSINRVGDRFKMWNSDKPCYQVHEDPLYKSIPFFMSSEGYGIYFDNTYKTNFDFGNGSDASYSFSAPGGEMEYYFIYGPSFKQILTLYTELTGKPIMPPSWAFGFAQCRGLLTNEDLTREIAKEYRERQIPCDIIYQDIGWTQHLQDFEWREGNYDDPVQMIADLESEGFKVIVSQDPVVSQNNQSQWQEADKLGYFVKDIRTKESYDMPWPWGGNCGLVDFTNPDVADWWGALQQKAVDAGVRGFWTDMGEPAWSNEEATDRLNMQHYKGMHEEIHNVYGATWDKVVTEQFDKRNPGTRIFQMTRSGFAGMQRYTFGWSGDAGNGNDVTNGWGQLAAQVPIAMSAGLGIIPFWSCDISGYCGDIEDYEAMSELYIRWLQFGAFNPLSRIHHEGNNAVEPWLFGEEAEKICKEAIEMKYRLFPYIYSYSREAHDKGWPLIRPLLLEYPEDVQAFDLNTQFLFGEELLVAPVVEEGAAYKKIYLPAGEWIDFNDKQTIYQGKQWIEYQLSLAEIPLFVKKGSIIPQMPVMQFIGEDHDYPLVLEIFPASTNRKALFKVYEDDGETNDYKQDIFGERVIKCLSKEDSYEIVYETHSSSNFQLQQRELIYVLHLEEKPAAIRLADKKIRSFKTKDMDQIVKDEVDKADWSWNKFSGECILRIPASSATELIIIEK